MRVIASLAALWVLTVPCLAEWDVQAFQDRMTDRKEAVATLAPKDGTGSVVVGCMNGRIFPRVSFPARIGVYEIGATYRFDNTPVEMSIARLSANGRDVWLWMGAPDPSAAIVERMRKSKRLRVQIGDHFLDYDLAGAEKALAGLRCR